MWDYGKRKVTAFAEQKRGQAAIIFALTLIPIVAISGFAIDFQTTSGSKQVAQATLDAAVLSGARSIQGGADADATKTMMIAQVKDRVATMPGVTCSDPVITYANNNKDITGKLKCAQETAISGVVGHEKMEFSVDAESTWDIGSLDIAFMFDVSGSMKGQRLTDLKAAATDALDIILPKDSAADKGTRVAMVAYEDNMNAGDLYEKVTGFTKKRTYEAVDRYRDKTQTGTKKKEKKVCTTISNTCVKRDSDGNCTKWDRKKKCEKKWVETPIYSYGPVKTRTVTQEVNSSCVWERYGIEAFTDAAPKGTVPGFPAIVSPKSTIKNATKIIYNASEDPDNSNAYMASGTAYLNDREKHKDNFKRIGIWCNNKHAVIPLTNDRSKLDKHVKQLWASGGTAGHQGIAWAWYMVSEKWQDTHVAESKPMNDNAANSTKALILMTDGDFIDENFKTEQGDSDTQAKALCDNIRKNKDIKVFSIAFQAPDKGQEILKYCATEDGMYFSASSGEELTEAYQEIARSISELRIKS